MGNKIGSCFSAIAGMFLLAACQTTGTGPEALQATWDKAYMTAPAWATAKGTPCASRMTGVPYACLNKMDETKKHPVIIYAHGCAGLDQRNLEPFRKLAVVVAPNSFARPNRRKDCGLRSDTKGISMMRRAEVKHTVDRLKTYPWVDPDRIILAGFSEGGSTTALYSGDEFKARIILGWVCTSGDPWWSGIRASNQTPILAVVGLEDEYSQGDRYGTHCGRSFGLRPKSKSIVIPGATHNIITLPQTQEAIEEFVASVF